MASEIWTHLEYFMTSSRIKKIKKYQGSMLEEKRPDHAISRDVTSYKSLLCCVNLKKNNTNNKKKCNFLKITFELLTFWLSLIVHRASLLEQLIHFYWISVA